MSPTPCLPCGGTQTVNVPGTPGQSAYAVATNQFTIPSVNQNVVVSVNQTSSFLEGQNVYVGLATSNGANFQVASIQSPYTITLKYLGFSGDLAAATVVPAGYLVVPGTGNIGSLTSQGFTTTTANFNIATSVTISVVSAAAFQIGQNVFIANATQRINGIVTAVPSSSSLTITVLNFPGDSPSGTINSGALVAPGSGNNTSFGTATRLASQFAIPGANATATATVFAFNAQGGTTGPKFVVLYALDGSGFYGTYAVSTSSSTALGLRPLLLPGESQSGTFPVGSLVIPVVAPNQGFAPGIAGDLTGVQLAVTATSVSGDGYTLTASQATVIFGTLPGTTIQITLPLAGTYVVFASANVNMVDATFAANQIVTVSVGAGGTGVTSYPGAATGVVNTPIVTTKTYTLTALPLGPLTVVVGTSGVGTVTMQASITALPTNSPTGSVELQQATLYAVKIA